ncbi:MAG TPA: hypothetical protein VJL83_05480 [Patescibacteria group bacterium]|nr:hypothetical protein [Patescibacteria group bacterium]
MLIPQENLLYLHLTTWRAHEKETLHDATSWGVSHEAPRASPWSSGAWINPLL